MKHVITINLREIKIAITGSYPEGVLMRIVYFIFMILSRIRIAIDHSAEIVITPGTHTYIET